MNTTENLKQLQELRLKGMEHSYQTVLQMPVHKHPQGHELLSNMLQAEIDYRRRQKTSLLLNLGKLRYVATIEQIICSGERNITKQQLAKLAECTYIASGENVLITGATGAGKSYFACALGHQACLMGYKTLYLNMNRFTERIHLSKLDGTFLKLLSQIEKVKLLILDDFGIQPFNENVRLALLQILEDRYQKKSTIIASQLPMSKWHDYIGEPTLADAIMDRLIYNAHQIELRGESLRKKTNK